MNLSRDRYDLLLYGGLLLFGLTLPLSKSAGNVLLFLLYPIAIAGIFLHQEFKDSIIAGFR